MSVYEDTNFIGRVNLAAAYISAGRQSTRTFDTCFEMWDGDAVVVALYRRSLANPVGNLAKNLSRYLNVESISKLAETLSHIPSRQLKHEAAKMRAEAKAKSDAWFANQRKLN